MDYCNVMIVDTDTLINQDTLDDAIGVDLQLPIPLVKELVNPVILNMPHNGATSYIFGSVRHIDEYELIKPMDTLGQLAIVNKSILDLSRWTSTTLTESSMYDVEKIPELYFKMNYRGILVNVYTHKTRGIIDGLLLDTSVGIFDRIDREYKQLTGGKENAKGTNTSRTSKGNSKTTRSKKGLSCSNR